MNCDECGENVPDNLRLCPACAIPEHSKASRSFAGARGSATVEKPHKVHVWVCGHYCGTYDFETAEEADADYEYRKGFRVLGCYYMRESPNAGDEACR